MTVPPIAILERVQLLVLRASNPSQISLMISLSGFLYFSFAYFFPYLSHPSNVSHHSMLYADNYFQALWNQFYYKYLLIHSILSIHYLVISLLSPPKAMTVRMDAKTSSATTPATLYAFSSFVVRDDCTLGPNTVF